MLIHSKNLLMTGKKKYTLTVVTNPASATCTLTYNGVQYSTKSLDVDKGSSVSYSVNHSTYGTTTGSIVMDSDKTLTCTGTYSTRSKFQLDSDLTKVGNPTITSTGLISGFTTTNYIQTIGSATSLMSSNNWEICVRFKCSAFISSTRQPIVMNKYHGEYARYTHGCNILFNGNKCYVRVASSTSSYIFSVNSAVLNTDTWYTQKVTFNGSIYTATGPCSNSKSSKTATYWHPTYGLYFGVIRGQDAIAQPATNCTIDMANSYIKSNGNYVMYNMSESYTYYWDTTIT